jgi:hypothetical protein
MAMLMTWWARIRLRSVCGVVVVVCVVWCRVLLAEFTGLVGFYWWWHLLVFPSWLKKGSWYKLKRVCPCRQAGSRVGHMAAMITARCRQCGEDIEGYMLCAAGWKSSCMAGMDAGAQACVESVLVVSIGRRIAHLPIVPWCRRRARSGYAWTAGVECTIMGKKRAWRCAS